MESDIVSDNGGRFWGDRLKKRKVPTILHLSTGQLIRGNVHITNQFRFIDDMNENVRAGNFIIVTESGKVNSNSPPPPIMYIHLDQIVWMAPDSILSMDSEALRGEPIEKRKVKVTIKTSTAHELVATANIKKTLRVIDDLNLSKDDKQFLSLTDVEITNLSPRLPVIPFLAINRHYIVFMIPEK